MELKRKFVPGSEWLYLKLYTGAKTADVILDEAIQPLVTFLLKENLIKKWFFIRYNDPKIHLRIRFELNDINNYNIILLKIREVLNDYIDSGEISSLIFDIYNRELERYGTQTINEAEFLFFKNSEFFIKECLFLDDEEKIITSLFYIDELLSNLGLPIDKKLDWIRDFNNSFKAEFNADKKLNSQLDKKYRLFKPKYLDFLESVDYLDFRNVVLSNIRECGCSMRDITSKSDEHFLKGFFQSLFHMSINRMFVSNQRIFEMIIYDYLYRYYKTVSFQNNQK
ncbi:lantibiotic dehydratase [Chryseobacterium sp. FH2]|nr:lantibiotic dehydratase [Chryseobacterium sp. FH2]